MAGDIFLLPFFLSPNAILISEKNCQKMLSNRNLHFSITYYALIRIDLYDEE